MEYKDKLNVSKDFKFGIELEFTNINIAYLYTIMKDKFPVQFKLNHKMDDFDFDKNWCLDQENSVTNVEKHNEYDRYMGGELSSRTFTDTNHDWKEIYDVCNFLKENDCKTDETCAFHMHISNNKFHKNLKFYEGLYKLIALYEDDFKIFYMGDKYIERPKSKDYAVPLKNRLLEKIDNIDFNNYESVYQNLFALQYDDFSTKDGLHVDYDINEIEVRYPNGTIDPNIVQNNVNFTLKLFDSLLNNKISIDKLDYLVKLKKEDRDIRNIHPREFRELVTTISNDFTDERDFIGQYKKVLSTK